MGTLVTLDLPVGSPVADLPWVITIGPLDDDPEWEPVVFGPYERGHALALGQAVVADEELMAVVEPLLPCAGADAIRAEIELARTADYDDELPAGDPETRPMGESQEPAEAEVRAGWSRIATRLTAPAG